MLLCIELCIELYIYFYKMANNLEVRESSIEAEISHELLNLKREIAKTTVEKIYENAGKHISNDTKTNLINYVIDNGKFSDKIWDFFIMISQKFKWNFISSLKDVREILTRTNTVEDLNNLRNSIQWLDWNAIQEKLLADTQKKDQQQNDKWETSHTDTNKGNLVSTKNFNHKVEHNFQYSYWSKNYFGLDNEWFSIWDKPFAHITRPYKWIRAYRVDNISWKQLLPSGNKKHLATIADLWKSWTEWPLTKVTPNKSITFDKFNKNTAWYKKNNPCNISPSSSYNIWLIWSSKVADWQNHAKFRTMEEWIASYMRMIRMQKDSSGKLMYANKSIQGINCWWMQWFYKPDEEDSLKALRIMWITHTSDAIWVRPTERLNTDDKNTLIALTQQTAIQETWSYLSEETCNKAYELAFS